VALTDGLKLPIPELTDSADGPAAVSGLANAVEDWSYDRILPSGVTRWPKHHWGPVTTLPSGTSVKRGDTAWYSPYNVMVMYDGTNWRQAEIQTVAVGGTGVADPSIPGFYPGQLRDHATFGQQRWNGTNWVPVKSTSADWALWPVVGAPFFVHNNISVAGDAAVPGVGAPGMQYRREGDRVFLRGSAFAQSALGASTAAGGNPYSSGPVAAEFRPPIIAYLDCYYELSTSSGMIRMAVANNGYLYSSKAMAINTYVIFDGLSYSLS
jgi:hypothetical protein